MKYCLLIDRKCLIFDHEGLDIIDGGGLGRSEIDFVEYFPLSPWVKLFRV
jgi:hypothetical protein